MDALRAELDARIAASRPADSVRGLFFNVILQVAQERGGPEGYRKVLPSHREVGYSEVRSYPAAEYLTLLYDIVALAPSSDALTAEEVNATLYECGAASVRRFANGAGQIVFGILGKADPHRLLSHAGSAYSTTVSYGVRTYEKRGEQAGTLSYAGDMLPPAYHQGIIEEALRALGTQGRAVPRVLAIDHFELDLSWD